MSGQSKPLAKECKFEADSCGTYMTARPLFPVVFLVLVQDNLRPRVAPPVVHDSSPRARSPKTRVSHSRIQTTLFHIPQIASSRK